MLLHKWTCTCEERELARADKSEPRLLVITFLHNKFLIDSILDGLSIFIGNFKCCSDLLCRQNVERIPATAVIDVPCNNRRSDI